MTAGQPLIFDIRHFSLEDGPGIRTTVFFKGCPLACEWCHNPESHRAGGEIEFHGQACLQCGDCVRACPHRSARLEEPERINRDTCQSCGQCAEICPSTALRKIGRFYTLTELERIVMQDWHFYQTSGGGVTFSGGEPTAHLDYLHTIAAALKANGVHLTLQTCGQFNYPEFQTKLLPYLDLVYYDVKFFDSSLHREYTGQPNELILENLKRLKAENRITVIPRIPLVQGITETKENLEAITGFLKSLGFSAWETLPYIPGGIEKRKRLGQAVSSRIPREGHWREKMKEQERIFTGV